MIALRGIKARIVLKNNPNPPDPHTANCAATFDILFKDTSFAICKSPSSKQQPCEYIPGAGGNPSNLAYVIGVLEGEVMRVLLLFYLAPLWTVPLARALLGERLDVRGGVVMAIAMAGAAVMLWHPEVGVPWPASRAEWLGVTNFAVPTSNIVAKAGFFRGRTMTDREPSGYPLARAGSCARGSHGRHAAARGDRHPGAGPFRPGYPRAT